MTLLSQSQTWSDLVSSGRVWRGHERTQVAAEPTSHLQLDAALPSGGWPLGALTEIVHEDCGSGEFRLVLPLLARLARMGRRIALLSPPHLPYAPALCREGVDLARVLVVDTPEQDLFWASEQLLHAGAGAVLMWARRADTQALRRLQLSAEAARSLVFLFHSGGLRSFSPAALRLRVTAGARVEVLKCRGGAVGQRLSLG